MKQEESFSEKVTGDEANRILAIIAHAMVYQLGGKYEIPLAAVEDFANKHGMTATYNAQRKTVIVELDKDLLPAKRPRNERTSAKVASAAGKVLRSKTASKAEKAAAASALTQRSK